MSRRISLVLAGGVYDRTMALETGRVRPEGIDLTYLSMPIEEVFWRALRHHEFDAAELSLAYYLALRSRGDDRYLAIPVFPSRFFRHGCVFVRTGSAAASLASLAGATVGLPEYTMTACVWLRGLLRDEHGIEPSEVHWRCGGVEACGRRDRADLPLPAGVDLKPIGPAETLNQLLCAGKLDAVISPRIPSGYFSGAIRRLIPDYQEAEQQYLGRTGIFPIMHVVALRREYYERFPWSARSVFDAYQRSKRWAYEWLADINALPVSLPWFVPEWERTRLLFGHDPWVDGLEPNRETLETFCGYLRQQQLADVADVTAAFAPNTLDEFVI